MIKKYSLKFSILIPTYNGSKVISDTLKSILSQSFDNFEIIITDDISKDDTEFIIKSIKDKRIKFYKNEKNLGYPGNLESARKKARGDIIYLMGQDDILAKDALLNTYNAFKISENIGAVTRPYFWFNKDIKIPVRAKERISSKEDTIVSINSDFWKIKRVFESLDQLSGLAYRKKYMDISFHPDIFPCHIYPFASIFKKHPIVFLKDYNIAVRIESSQTIHVSSIYKKSPIEDWKKMIEFIFSEKKFLKLRKRLIKDFIARNYVGLLQIRNYGKYSWFLREVKYLIKYRWQNLFSISFWFFTLGCAILPKRFLIFLINFYKKKINSKILNNKNIQFRWKK